MKNSEPAIRSALRVSVISGAIGFINGVGVILAQPLLLDVRCVASRRPDSVR